MKKKRALICGISGQDGAYLARLLIDKNYEVFGTSRDVEMSQFQNLKKLQIFDSVVLYSMTMTDFRNTLQILDKIRPDEIYNLAGQTSVGLSFDQPAETLDSIAKGTLNLLECIRALKLDTRLYNAGSGECFGDTASNVANELTSFRPMSPYAVAKSAAHWQVSCYRSAYGIHACTGFLFNHESPLRPERFVTQKIVKTALRISRGDEHRLRLGNLHIQRDWGWSPEYVKAMWGMLQLDKPEDFVIATGASIKLFEFVEVVFEALNMDWRKYVESDPALFRSSDQLVSRADPSKAMDLLGWKAVYQPKDVALKMVQSAVNGDVE